MKYTPAEKLAGFKKVLKAVEDGEPLRNVLMRGDAIGKRVFYDMIRESEELRAQYAHAKEIAAEMLFDRMLEIAENPQEGQTIQDGPNGVTITSADMLGHRRLLIDTIKWRLSKEAPKKYGDKLDLTSGDKPLLAPVIGMIIKNELPEAEETQNLQDDEFGDLD
jgi:hypothetical protein